MVTTIENSKEVLIIKTKALGKWGTMSLSG
jgi:hypothetical protein